MNNSLKDIYTKAFERIVKRHTANDATKIFVIAGVEPYVDLDKFKDHITDAATFNEEGNLKLFSQTWFGGVLAKLMSATSYCLLSHQQYASINEYLTPDFFKQRAVVVYDNLRTLYPLDKGDYMEKSDAKGDDVRPEDMPCYQAEQFKIGYFYYYSLKRFDDGLTKVPLFTARKELMPLSNTDEDSVNVIDVVSDPYGLDVMVNKCVKTGDFSKVVYVKISGKNELGKATMKALQEVNALLSRFGGGVYLLQEEAVRKDYVPKAETLALLRKYWGEKAEFRDIKVYENPELNNTIIPVSQGYLVDTIISEYEKGRQGIVPRDIFITAPTGAGKSLIFQLPAFYAASKGDVTIVVSPLKALMTDQVEALRNQRNYDQVEFINSDLTLIDRDKIIDSCKRGDVDILYLSPELLLSYDIHYFIGERNLGLLVVDEAHLITTWGRDFRVDYWFLGNHIYKMRKYNSYMFPLVALTATAVYGGVNDMVFDSINSLNMHDPHKFIGNVKRENIEFVFDTHDDYSTGSYDQNKEAETVNIIKGLHDLGMKSIVYAPYTRHVDILKAKCDEVDKKMAVAFHGRMSPDEQKYAYQSFKSNTCKIMISTKAFGMGVDIPDIQVVYHHAPSGLLPDYIQEIGRAARKKEMQGFAALTFSKSDLRYSRQLFGMSSLKTFQLKEVLKKVIRFFKSNDRKRNMLIAANDFAYIFDTTEDVDQKVATALMMIEKDYLIKTRFNVLIARPKKLFTKVFARTTPISLERLQQKYGKCFKTIPIGKGNYYTLELNLDKIWTKHFSDKSFPQIKSEFYRQKFLENEGIELKPLIKVSITIDNNYQDLLAELKKVFSALNRSFSNFWYKGAFFTQKEFVEQLSLYLDKKYDVEKVTAFVLGTYSVFIKSGGVFEGDSFLQQRRYGNKMQYRVFSTNYESQRTKLMSIFSKLFDGNPYKSVDRYLSTNDIPLKNHIRLGSLLEILDLGTFESTGGDDPKIFLRLNDPRRVEKDSESNSYTNVILESVKNRHKFSCELFEHFFTHYFSNDKRWDMIEDFFLGMSNDELFEKYPGIMSNHVDILEYLKNNQGVILTDEDVSKSDNAHRMETFKPKENAFYDKNSYLTIEHLTKPVKRWLIDDPVALHRTIEEYHITISPDDFKVLQNKLRLDYFPYYRDFMRLRLKINFPKYDGLVQASVPYQDHPVEFYKWWKKHKNDITMNFEEEVKLFLKVDSINPKALNNEHKAKIKK